MTGVNAISCKFKPQYSSTAKSASTYWASKKKSKPGLAATKVGAGPSHLHIVQVVPVYKLEQLLRDGEPAFDLLWSREVRAARERREWISISREPTRAEAKSARSHVLVLSNAASSERSLAIFFWVATSLRPALRTAFATTGSNVALSRAAARSIVDCGELLRVIVSR